MLVCYNEQSFYFANKSRIKLKDYKEVSRKLQNSFEFGKECGKELKSYKEVSRQLENSFEFAKESSIELKRYEGQSISNASYFFSFTFQENSNTIT